MVSFAAKWARSDKPGIVDRVRKVVRPPPPLKPKIEDAQRKLQVQIVRLDTVQSKLKDRDQTLFKRIVSAVHERDTQYAGILSSELSELRKIGKMVTHAKLAMEQIQIRLNTITELGDVVLALNPAMAVVKNVRTGLSGMMPEVDSEMEEISQLLSGILVESSQVPNNTIPISQVTDGDTQAILDEAASIVESSVKAKLPDLPLMTSGTKDPEKREPTFA